jgi:hypothetical protein
MEREYRLAGDHLREASKLAETPLRAEQREGERVFDMDIRHTGDGSAPGPDHGQRWLTADREPPTTPQRQMTPDEIREVELKSLAERVSLLDGHATAFGAAILSREVKAIIDGRLDALRPEQTSTEVADDLAAGRTTVNKVRQEAGLPELGLPYRQEATAGTTVVPNTRPDETLIIHGKRLDIDLTIPGGRRAHDIPPYQVDQLRAIADGRPSWPDTTIHGWQPLTALQMWLIERGQPERQVPTVWWADRKRWGLTYMDDWTDDANKAFRFESREAAEEVIAAKFTPPASRGGPSARAV